MIPKKTAQTEISSIKLYSGKDYFYWSPFKGLHNNPSDQTAFRGNRNFCISGVAGSGKSVFCKQAIANVLAEGGKVVVFDKDKDYYHMCLHLKGDYITGDKASDLSVDLFSMVPDGESSGDQYERGIALEYLTSLILMMGLPEESFKGESRVHVEKALGCVWRNKGKNGQLIDVINALEINNCLIRDDAIKRGEDLSNSLSRYLAQWHSYFKKDKDSCIQADFTVVDTSICQKTIAQTLITWMLMRVWHHQQVTNVSQPFLVLFEDSLGFEPSREFSSVIKLFSIAARKKRISLGKVTFSVRDISEENTSHNGLFEKGFWDHADCQIFFREDSGSNFDAFVNKNRASFSEDSIKILQSLCNEGMSYNFAMSFRGHPFRKYTKLSEEATYAAAA